MKHAFLFKNDRKNYNSNIIINVALYFLQSIIVGIRLNRP